MAFLLGAALLRTLRGRGFFAGREEPKLIELLDLVALGTVADVAQLRGLNRAFVTQGLKVMAGRRNIGLAALADAARLSRAPECRDLGFALGPRINAGGRVGKSDLGVRLLTTEDPAEAEAIAAELDRLNEERRAIEAAVCEAAEALRRRARRNRAVALVAAPGWHPGVIGIVAGRLKEKLHRPAIVVALGEDGIGKGSGRSISGVDLGAAVLAAKDSGLLIAGGGHAMAAGLTVAARPDRGARRLPRRAARGRRRPQPRRPRAAARRLARAGRDQRRLLRRARGGRALWRRLARPARRRRPGRHRQGRRGRQRPFARDRRRRRRPPGQGDRLPHGRQPARRGAARRAAAPPAVARRPRSSATITMAAAPPSSTSRTPPGPMLDRLDRAQPLSRGSPHGPIV